MKFLMMAFVLGVLPWVVFAQAFKEETIKLDSIEGSLMMPALVKGAIPVALIIAGSGPTDRNGNNPVGLQTNAYKKLAEGLAEQGIATLRYDKRGIGKSQIVELDEADLNIDIFIDDAVKWLEKLRKDRRFSSLFIAGHSEGSLIGMMAAQRVKINGFISVAGPARPADELIMEQLKGQPEIVTKEAAAIFSELKKGRVVDSVSIYLYSLFRPSVQPYMVSWVALDPAAEFAKLSVPTLIIQGTHDIQVPILEAELLHKAQPRSQLALMEGMNHILRKCEADRSSNLATYSQPDLPLFEGLLKTVSTFIKLYK